MPITLPDGNYETFVFSGGEVHVRVNKKSSKIVADIKDSEDIMRLLMLAEALKPIDYLTIEIPYFPYARQDRICNDGEAFSLKVMSNLINSIKADKVIIYDPHSDVTPALINNVEIVHQHEIIPPSILKGKTIVCPDAGAEKKILKLKRPYIMATKVRDVSTGDIIATKVYSDSLTDHTCIIIDDICDGGRTFIELAKVLKAKGAKSVELYVTHGIFSKGLNVFTGLIDKIYHYNNGEIKCLSIH